MTIICAAVRRGGTDPVITGTAGIPRKPARVRRLLAAAAAGFAIAITVPSPARAQSALVSSTPAPGATVAPGMSVVALTFDNPTAEGSGRITITGAVKVLTGRPVVADGTLCAAVAPLTNGAYTVLYNATSTEGNPISGRFTFTVADNGRPTGIPKPCDTVELPTAFPVSGGYATLLTRHDPPLAVITGLAVLGGAVFACWYLLRSRPSAGSRPER